MPQRFMVLAEDSAKGKFAIAMLTTKLNIKPAFSSCLALNRQANKGQQACHEPHGINPPQLGLDALIGHEPQQQ